MPVTLHLWPAPQPWVAGGGAFLPQGLSSPPTPGLGLQTPRAAGQRSGKAAHWLCQDFTAQSWLLARLPRLLGKGPCSLPQALHVGPPAAHPGESRYSRTSCLAPDPPWSPALGPGQAPASPPMASCAGFPLHQPRSEVLGAPAWSQASTLTTRSGTGLGLVERCF